LCYEIIYSRCHQSHLVAVSGSLVSQRVGYSGKPIILASVASMVEHKVASQPDASSLARFLASRADNKDTQFLR
jgi:hypothetical protein